MLVTSIFHHCVSVDKKKCWYKQTSKLVLEYKEQIHMKQPSCEKMCMAFKSLGGKAVKNSYSDVNVNYVQS